MKNLSLGFCVFLFCLEHGIEKMKKAEMKSENDILPESL